MINPDNERLSIRSQCKLVSISWASFYWQPAGESPENHELMRIIDEALMETPWYGSRQMARHLHSQGWCADVTDSPMWRGMSSTSSRSTTGRSIRPASPLDKQKVV